MEPPRGRHPGDPVPLSEVTFVVVDTETTGGSPATCALTDVAAARFRGGECVGTFQTLVNPGMPVPATISALTGISDDMVAAAPPVSAVLPSLLEFIGDGVIVGHNIRFDLAFLDAALVASGRPPLANTAVDTLALARRLLRPEVPDCKLATLARWLRLPHGPTHRALADVLTTGDLLHRLIEQATGYGVLDLRDLLELPTLAHHPQAAKLALTARLPRRPGVYWFEDAERRVLHLAAAADVRAHARGQFALARTTRRLRPLRRVGHGTCTGMLEAQVVEARLAARLTGRPRPGRRAYLVVDPDGSVQVTASPAGAGAAVGPLPAGDARAAADAVRAAVAAGLVDVGLPTRAFGGEPDAAEALRRLAATAEDPALGTLARAVEHQRRVDALRRHRRLELDADGERVVLVSGVVAATAGPDGTPGTMLAKIGRCPVPCPSGPLRADVATELAVVARWVGHQLRAGRLRVVRADAPFAWPDRAAPGRSAVAVGSAACSTPSS